MARPDNDTFQYGTKPPFEDWEHDHTALVHVLWGARHQDLNLKDNADEIAEMILCSRWLAARQHLAGTSARKKLAAVRALIDDNRLGETRLIPATELRAALDA